MKRMLMPESFIVDVYRLLDFLYDYELDHRTMAVCVSLEEQLAAKQEAMDRHRTFSAYKAAAPGSSQREALRAEYLDKTGILQDWRSMDEVPYFQ